MTALKCLFCASSHSFDLGEDESKGRVTWPIELVDLEMVCVEGYLGMAVDTCAGLGYNLANVRRC